METKKENNNNYSLTNHPTSRTLEVIAITQSIREKDKYAKLNPSEKKEYIQALNHTRICRGCKDQYGQMREFYGLVFQDITAKETPGTIENIRMEELLKKIHNYD